MKHRYTIVAFLISNIMAVLSLHPSAAIAQQLDSEKLLETCKAGVVLIIDQNGQGSGFVVNEYGYIITNYHVIEDARYNPTRLRVVHPNGTQSRVVSLAAVDRNHDLALLQIRPNDDAESISLPILPYGEARQGAEVATIGNNLGSGFTISKGIIANIHEKALQLDIAVNSGNSGGALLNRNAQVVGVIVAKWKGVGVEGVSFAIRADLLRNFLDKHNISYQTQALINDVELKKARELSQEEQEALKHKELERIALEQNLEREKYRRQRYLDSLDAVNAAQRKAYEQQQSLAEIDRQKQARELALEREKMRLQEEKQRRIEEKRAARRAAPGHFSLRLGLGAEYTQPNALNPIPDEAITAGIAPFGQMMLAYRFGFLEARQRRRSSSMGLFGKSGLLSQEGITRLARIQAHVLPSADQLQNLHPYYELELGGLVREWFRLSAGIGSQRIATRNAPSQTLGYYSTTLGFIARLGLAEFDLAGQCLFGEAYKDPAWRVSLSLNLHLKFLKW